MKAGRRAGIDIALDAIADHPACMRREFMAMEDCAVSRAGLFRRRSRRRRSNWRRPERANLSACSASFPLGREEKTVVARRTPPEYRATAGQSSISCSAMERSEAEDALVFFSMGAWLRRSKQVASERVKLVSP